MKAGGHFNELFDRWNDEHKRDAPGFVVACVGTKRVQYADGNGDWTWDEGTAKVWRHQGACAHLGQVLECLFGYCRVVATKQVGRRLPTINGY